MIAVAVVALIVIGPKELPAVLRTVGQWTTRIRRMAAEFQGQFQEALREAEMADLKKEIDSFNDGARGLTTQISDSLNVQDATKWEPAAEKKPDTGAETTPVETTLVEAPVETTPAGNPDADAVVSAEPAATAEAAAADIPPAAAPGAIEVAAGPDAAADTPAPPSPLAVTAKGAPVHDS
ncbi:MAG: Sec-independent protein translocase protein TatB [Alphaproteobacteria bacterium]|nr:Sec-independent protein translocase protein TatB [Alphaproteobacteria bacterium]